MVNNLINPEPNKSILNKFLNLMTEIDTKKDFCFKKLINDLNFLYAKEIGIIWEKDGKLVFGFGKKINEKGVKKIIYSEEESVVTWKTIKEEIKNINDESSFLLPYFRIDTKEKNDLIFLIEIPRLYKENIGEYYGSIYIFEPRILRKNYDNFSGINLIQKYIFAWISALSFYQTNLRNVFGKFNNIGGEINTNEDKDKETKESKQLINNNFVKVCNTLTLEELVKVKNYLVKTLINKEDLKYFPNLLSPFPAPKSKQNNDFKDMAKINYKDFYFCAPPNWPPDCCNCQFLEDTTDKELTDLENKTKLLFELSHWLYTDNYQGEILRKDQSKKFKNRLNEIQKMAFKEIKIDNNQILKKLGHKSLLNFFLGQVLTFSNDKVKKFWLSDAPSNEHVMMATSSIAQITQYAFTKLPLTNKVIQSIILLISEYAHNTLQIPHRIDFRSHFLHNSKSDLPLYVLKSFYRDHFFHSIEVCFMGHFLLELKIGEKFLWQYISENMNCIEKQQVLKLWYLISLLHDTGYSITVLKNTIDHLKFFSASKIHKKFGKKFYKNLQELSEDLIADLSMQYNKEDEPGKEHGAFAAKYLKELLFVIGKKKLVEEYDEAIRAIGLHNARNHEVCFSKNPLSFLLIICDSIQEWNRTYFDFSTAPIKILSKLKEPHNEYKGFEDILDSINIKDISLGERTSNSKEEPFFKLSKKKLHIILEYTQKINHDSGVFNLWLDASYNLQRLDFQGLPLEIDIEYITPLYNDKEGKEQKQFYRLQNAVRQTHMGFIENWFPDKPIKKDGQEKPIKVTNDCVTYEYKENKEHLTLHLQELCKQKLLEKDIDTFRKDLTKWKDYNEDRTFLGDYGRPEYPS